ncbi:MAG: glycosyltransferase, partial [Bacteroidia bacterium]|nr:glycosyltransferase [Bacteroidia bacterium]
MNHSNRRVAVVILNWNGKAFLEKFLPGVFRSCTNIADLIVVDNASTDDSVKFLEANFPSVQIIRLLKNDGYTGGYNEGLKQV